MVHAGRAEVLETLEAGVVEMILCDSGPDGADSVQALSVSRHSAKLSARSRSLRDAMPRRVMPSFLTP